MDQMTESSRNWYVPIVEVIRIHKRKMSFINSDGIKKKSDLYKIIYFIGKGF